MGACQVFSLVTVMMSLMTSLPFMAVAAPQKEAKRNISAQIPGVGIGTPGFGTPGFGVPGFGISSYSSFGSSSFGFGDCGCEDDIWDSCNNIDNPCCAPLSCQNNRCVPTCQAVNQACNINQNQCCGYLNQVCQRNPAIPGDVGVCVQCPAANAACNILSQPGTIGSCCYGFACQANPLNPLVTTCVPVVPPVVGK